MQILQDKFRHGIAFEHNAEGESYGHNKEQNREEGIYPSDEHVDRKKGRKDVIEEHDRDPYQRVVGDKSTEPAWRQTVEKIRRALHEHNAREHEEDNGESEHRVV